MREVEIALAAYTLACLTEARQAGQVVSGQSSEPTAQVSDFEKIA